MVGVEIAGGSAELGGHGDIAQGTQLLFEAVDVDHELLAQARGRGGLAVGAGEHGHGAPLLGVVVEQVDELFEQGDVDAVEGLLQGQGYGGVVDVLGGESEVDEVLGGGRRKEEGGRRKELIEALLDVVFDGFDVVVGDGLDVLHALGLLGGELLVDGAQGREEFTGEAGQLRQGQLAEGDEILYFHADAIAYERILRKEVREGLGFSTVAAVNRRNGGEGCEFHFCCCSK